MEKQWTDQQKTAIDLDGCSLLVSAAAGSGKTAVLVERILRLITEGNPPADLDRLLVVTFTRAAAGEMKERIQQALAERLEADPENLHLQRQAALAPHAMITTIHGFCLDVIRSHFDRIGLDPGFRVADGGEVSLLKQDVLRDLLEEFYENGEPEFLEFAQMFASGRTDQGLEDLIDRFYTFSCGYPDPGAWRRKCTQPGTDGSLPWMEGLLYRTGLMAEDLRKMLERALEICSQSSGPWMYEENIRQDLMCLKKLDGCKNYSDYYRAFPDAQKWGRISTKKDPDVSDTLRNEVKSIRTAAKGELKRWAETYFLTSPDKISQENMEIAKRFCVLSRLTDAFEERFAEEKRRRGIVDFTDLEQMACWILLETDEDGNLVRSRTAREYAQRFVQVMIDEYQDSNLIQEKLLWSVSGEEDGHPNRFLVGDVKQSIYRFRLARPELFTEKYQNYRKADGKDSKPYQRIDLNRNFRSRREILDCVNEVFSRIMIRAAGSVDYDEDAALYEGAQYPPKENPEPAAEILLIADDSQEMEEASAMTRSDRITAEALAAAARIREMILREQVYDRRMNAMRPCRYSDIVILLRTLSGWGDLFARTLISEGIPAYTTVSGGYFSAVEVRVMLSMLSLLDNPRQDEALAAVLSSPIAGLNDRELARIRVRTPEGSYYNACKKALESIGEEAQWRTMDLAVQEKLQRFHTVYQELREMVPFTPIHELIWKVMDKTGYEEAVLSMQAGEIRSANLQMLAEKAMQFGNGSYQGLFRFVRYIESLQKYEIDYGEAQPSGEADDAVRIMSIHKSKGLEFPVVFVCGLGKQFNLQDSSGSVILHPSCGAACDLVDPQLRTRRLPLAKKVLAGTLRDEDLGEELRVLYVAMTRAKEKLILMGAVKKPEESVQKWMSLRVEEGQVQSYPNLIHSRSFLDLIMPAVYSGPLENGYFILKSLLCSEITAARMQEESSLFKFEELMEIPEGLTDEEEHSGSEIRAMFERLMSSRYPYPDLSGIPPKISVSELKHEWIRKMNEQEQEEPELRLFHAKDENTAGQDGLTGAERGTLYHRFLELLDFSEEHRDGFLQSQLESMVNCGKISSDLSGAIRMDQMETFWNSPLAQRMKTAQAKGCLHRETPFSLGLDASEVRKEWPSGEMVLIQGIIDVWFEEDGQIILVDYKTDRVGSREEETLARRYKVQMELYKEALTRLTGRKVAQIWLYSFSLGKEIRVLT